MVLCHMHGIPEWRWAKVGTDLFVLNEKNYLIAEDYNLEFYEIDGLENTESKAVMEKMKSHRIPDIVANGNGPRNTSEEFSKFSEKWDLEQVTSSPGNSQSNGEAESAVESAKGILKKCQ